MFDADSLRESKHRARVASQGDAEIHKKLLNEVARSGLLCADRDALFLSAKHQT